MSAGNKGAVGIISGFILVMGLVFMTFMGWPVVTIVRAGNWRSTPCTILTSALETHPASKGRSTYSIAMTYEYVVDGKRYVSDRYQIMGGSSSGYEGKKAAVDRLTPGTKTVCYVKPGDPAQALINRDVTDEMVFVLVPTLMILGGLLGLLVEFGKRLGREPERPKA